MGSVIICLIAFLCIFAGALFGLFLRSILPEHHLSDKSKDAVKTGIGLIATLTALVLGLLVSSSKSSFDAMNEELKQTSAKVISLDHILARYGSETQEIRDQLRRNIASAVAMIWHEDGNTQGGIKDIENAPGIEEIRYQIQKLEPKNNLQQVFKSEALQISADISQARWLLIEETQSSLPIPFLIVLVFWLVIFFLGFGMLSPSNLTVISVMLICSLSVAGAIFLILEMDHPLEGTIKVSSASLHKALSHMN